MVRLTKENVTKNVLHSNLFFATIFGVHQFYFHKMRVADELSWKSLLYYDSNPNNPNSDRKIETSITINGSADMSNIIKHLEAALNDDVVVRNIIRFTLERKKK